MLKLFTTLLFVIILFFFKKGESFKCFICRSDINEGCNDKNLSYSKECPTRGNNGSKIYCRKIVQKLKFKNEDSLTSIRECAYEKGSSDCYQYRWTELALQETCECDKENCNGGSVYISNFLTVVLVPSLARIFNFFKIDNT